jgi:hypothetical protein
MRPWTADEREAFGGPDEIRISSLRPDGSRRPPITIWIARLGDELYVRSAHGPDNGWYRRARASGAGTITAGRRTTEVRFEDADPAVAEALHTSYHAKYDRYGPNIVGTVVSEDAAGATLRLVPAG